jgi:hypothetical protein
MDEGKLREREHIALSTAAAITYQQVVRGAAADSHSPEEMDEILSRVALAISTVAPIYALDASGTPKQVASAALLRARFSRGATVLQTNGVEYSGLTIQRADMREAIAILMGARARFGPEKSS